MEQLKEYLEKLESADMTAAFCILFFNEKGEILK